MTVIGITGPTGAGKTTVLNVLRDMGGAVVDCDALYHELLRRDISMQNELKARFGQDIFDENDGLRRKALGVIVFEDQSALEDLNAITHRHVVAEAERRIAQAGALWPGRASRRSTPAAGWPPRSRRPGLRNTVPIPCATMGPRLNWKPGPAGC